MNKYSLPALQPAAHRFGNDFRLIVGTQEAERTIVAKEPAGTSVLYLDRGRWLTSIAKQVASIHQRI